MTNIVKVERVRRRIQQKELARILGVSRQSIYAMEECRYVPTVQLALKMAALFNLKVEELFKLEDSEMESIVPLKEE